jgi:hypothetical protein
VLGHKDYSLLLKSGSSVYARKNVELWVILLKFTSFKRHGFRGLYDCFYIHHFLGYTYFFYLSCNQSIIKKFKIAYFTEWRSAKTSLRHSLFSKCQTVSRYTPKCNFIYARDKGTVFPAPIFVALTNDQQHFVKISDTEFDPVWTIHVQSRDINSHTLLNKARLSLYSISRNLKLGKHFCRHLLNRIISKIDWVSENSGKI